MAEISAERMKKEREKIENNVAKALDTGNFDFSTVGPLTPYQMELAGLSFAELPREFAQGRARALNEIMEESKKDIEKLLTSSAVGEAQSATKGWKVSGNGLLMAGGGIMLGAALLGLPLIPAAVLALGGFGVMAYGGIKSDTAKSAEDLKHAKNLLNKGEIEKAAEILNDTYISAIGEAALRTMKDGMKSGRAGMRFVLAREELSDLSEAGLLGPAESGRFAKMVEEKRSKRSGETTKIDSPKP